MPINPVTPSPEGGGVSHVPVGQCTACTRVLAHELDRRCRTCTNPAQHAQHAVHVVRALHAEHAPTPPLPPVATPSRVRQRGSSEQCWNDECAMLCTFPRCSDRPGGAQ